MDVRHAKEKSSAPLRPRLEKARKENQTKLALDLAHELAKAEPSQENQDLLRQVTFERGKALLSERKPMEAAIVFQNAAKLGGPPEFRISLAEALACAGAIGPSMEIVRSVGDSAVQQMILGHIADASLDGRVGGRELLPPEHHPTFDAVRNAFDLSEQGKDEEARTELQKIGLQSPFLDWKILLRGLLAYYSRDDAKALENWQRLDPNRLPYKLASIPRCHVDPKYRSTQPPATQEFINRKLPQLQTGIGSILRDLRKQIGQGEDLREAFRIVDKLLPIVKQSYPHLLPRLQQLFRSTIIKEGSPEDIPRYSRAFGAPAEDPQLCRVTALAQESHGFVEEACETWRTYAEFVEKKENLWAPEKKALLVALIWEHIGRLMANEEKDLDLDPDDLDFFVPRKKKKKKSKKQPLDAVECFRKSIQGAPGRLAPRFELFKTQMEKKQSEEAKKTGLSLLERFPGHIDTLEEMGGLCLREGDFVDAVGYFEQAVKGDAFRQRLREKLACACQNLASDLGMAKKWDEARLRLDTALRYAEKSRVEIHCARIVLELKAKNEEAAQRILADLRALPNQRLTIPFALVGESVRLKLSPAQKKEFQTEWNEARQAESTPAEILELLEMMARQREVRVKAYLGQKTREKEALKFFEKIPYKVFDERSFEKLVMGLAAMGCERLVRQALPKGRTYFPKNIRLRLLDIERGVDANNPYIGRLEHSLDEVHKLVQEIPRGEEQEKYLAEIRKLRDEIAELTANSRELLDMFSSFFGGRSPF